MNNVHRFCSYHFTVKTRLALNQIPRPQAARGPRRRRRAKHVPIAGGAAPPGGQRLAPGEYIPVELLPELPPLGARALPEHGPLPGPALSPAPRHRRRPGARALPEHEPLLGPAPPPRRGAEGRVHRGAPQAVVPRRTPGRAAEDVREVQVGPVGRRGHGDAGYARGSGE